MTEDQRNLGLIHPCLHKQNENRIPAFYRKSKTWEGSNCFSWRIQPRIAVVSRCVLREALDGQEFREEEDASVCSPSAGWYIEVWDLCCFFSLSVPLAARHTCAYSVFI